MDDASTFGKTLILGVGIDIIEISRFARDDDDAKALAKRIFTSDELKYCTSKSSPARHLAARFAAKEAFVKALGIGLSCGMSWREIAVEQDEAGKPVVRLSGGAEIEASKRSVERIHISLSHSSSQAVAVVVLEGKIED